jgi:hypothetical protein
MNDGSWSGCGNVFVVLGQPFPPPDALTRAVCEIGVDLTENTMLAARGRQEEYHRDMWGRKWTLIQVLQCKFAFCCPELRGPACMKRPSPPLT